LGSPLLDRGRNAAPTERQRRGALAETSAPYRRRLRRLRRLKTCATKNGDGRACRLKPAVPGHDRAHSCAPLQEPPEAAGLAWER